MMLRSAFVATLLLVSASAAAKGDAEAGKAKSTVCQACHGVDGNGTGDGQYPRIAGQHADYLVHALKAYQTRTQKSAPQLARANAIMAGFADTLSDEDIENLAAYFASQPSPLHDLSHLK